MCEKTNNTKGRLLSVSEVECFLPKTIEDAVDILDKYKGEARVLSGGTDILNQMKRRVNTPKYLVDIKNIEDLKYIKQDDDAFFIGAATSISDVYFSEVLREKFPIFAETTGFIATPQIRNRGTMMGNICNAVPSADSAPPLIVHDAYVVALSKKGRREIPVEEFLVGPKKCALEDGELGVEIVIPKKNGKSTYRKHQTRAEGDLAVVGVAVYLEMDLDGKTCRDAKIALGAVGPKPIRALEAEKLLKGFVLSEEQIEKAAEMASNEAKPIDDIRASAWYRKEMVKVHTRRAINHILNGDEPNILI